jgi:hypothetical protein
MTDPATPPPASIYQGLSQNAKLVVIAFAGFIAALNLGVAWYMSNGALQSLKLAETDMAPFVSSIEKAAGKDGTQLDASARHDLAARAMHIVALTKLVSNKQGLVVVCFGGAFALAAMGFALFVIGADGAFQVTADSSEKARIVLSGTAPGLLCFLLASWLVVTGVKDKSQIDLPPFRIDAQGGAMPDPPATCAYKPAGKCMTKEEFDAALANPENR